MEAEYIKQASAILSLNNFGEYLLAILIMAFIPALCEETLFRGGLQNFLSRWTKNPWLSIVIVSILFSIAHLSFYGFLSRLFLGIMLGLLFHYSGKLWLCILAHFLNNAFAITAIYVYKSQGKSIAEAMNDSGDGTWYGVLALPVFIALFIVFKKMRVKPPEEKDEKLRDTIFY
jgi:membrane protease YdiL (CAAX protease family)